MRLIVGGGGSGGHAFPALAVAETLRIMLREDLTLLYVGREDGMEAAIARDAGIEFAPIVARALRGRHPLSQLWSTLTLAAGVWGAIGVVRRFQPDVVFVTDDNPRGEDPAAIRRQILAGCPGTTEVGDRAEAIRLALATLAAGDVLVVAGKGHEQGQIVGDRVRPFDYVEVVRRALAEAAP